MNTPNSFKREGRYYVTKIKDAKKYLTTHEQSILHILIQKVDDARWREGRLELQCVIVEKDWPEYEPTWKAIEARMTQSNL